VLINATLKGTFAPVALPKREFMENAKAIWERLGLPPLKPSRRGTATISATGRSAARQARMATASDYFALVRNRRRSDAAMSR
jgi:4-hydroxy-3-polyprenylbenzoate decarboxylase